MPIVRTRRIIEDAGAESVIAAAERHALAHDLRVVITVVDPWGEVVLLRRTPGAQVASSRVAVDKARTGLPPLKCPQFDARNLAGWLEPRACGMGNLDVSGQRLATSNAPAPVPVPRSRAWDGGTSIAARAALNASSAPGDRRSSHCGARRSKRLRIGRRTSGHSSGRRTTSSVAARMKRSCDLT